MEATGSESLQHRLILPTQQLPASLQHIKGSPTPQFLVGYRNVLVASGQGVCWGLVKNEGYCGRAFVFEIGKQEATKID